MKWAKQNGVPKCAATCPPKSELPSSHTSGLVSPVGIAITSRNGCFSTSFPPVSHAIRSRTAAGKCSAATAAFGLSACAVNPSDPGARPSPRSILPGAIASSTRNCSATFSAE